MTGAIAKGLNKNEGELLPTIHHSGKIVGLNGMRLAREEQHITISGDDRSTGGVKARGSIPGTNGSAPSSEEREENLQDAT
jgi:hypothetical protein